MNRLTKMFGIALFACASAALADCNAPANDAETAACLGDELRASDGRINAGYGALMKTLGDAEKKQLRDEQRAWLKRRDSACRLDNKESNRERWMQAILRDYQKTVCVVRFTNARSEQIERLAKPNVPAPAVARAPAAAAPAPTAPVAPPSAPPLPANWGDDDDYEIKSAVTHTTGKWYFEVLVQPGEVVKTAETALFIGITGPESNLGRLLQIRKRNADSPPGRIGIAADLDQGKLYISMNGAWRNEPGSNAGLDIKLGRPYVAKITSSSSLKPMAQSGAVKVNFGDSKMEYALPAGYRPFAER